MCSFLFVVRHCLALRGRGARLALFAGIPPSNVRVGARRRARAAKSVPCPRASPRPRGDRRAWRQCPCRARSRNSTSSWWSYDDPKDDEPEETWDFHYEQVDKTYDRNDRTETITFRGTFNHKDGVAKDEFVLVATHDSPCTYTGRGESDFGKYTIVGEIVDPELDGAGLNLRKLVVA